MQIIFNCEKCGVENKKFINGMHELCTEFSDEIDITRYDFTCEKCGVDNYFLITIEALEMGGKYETNNN